MERNIFIDPDSITRCNEFFDNFRDRDLRLDYHPWDNVDVHGREYIFRELPKFCKVVTVISTLIR